MPMPTDLATALRQALEAIERDRVDSFDSGFTQLPKGTVNMVIDLLRGALHSEARIQRPGSTASTFDTPPVAAASSRTVKFTSDKRRTCDCGHRYGAHSTDGQHCLAQVDLPGATSSQLCSCHGWTRAVDPSLSQTFECRCGATVDKSTGIGNDSRRHPRPAYFALHPSLHLTKEQYVADRGKEP